ncbi:MAG: hypothetical protein JXB29_11170 [Sedimentisphaerales bacterium]|nr:hypothetical protein [Sedimentisphaerales bacterium]
MDGSENKSQVADINKVVLHLKKGIHLGKYRLKRCLGREAGVSKPDDMHWDEVPVAVVEFREDHELDEDNFTEDIYDDCGLDVEEL